MGALHRREAGAGRVSAAGRAAARWRPGRRRPGRPRRRRLGCPVRGRLAPPGARRRRRSGCGAARGAVGRCSCLFHGHGCPAVVVCTQDHAQVLPNPADHDGRARAAPQGGAGASASRSSCRRRRGSASGGPCRRALLAAHQTHRRSPLLSFRAGPSLRMSAKAPIRRPVSLPCLEPRALTRRLARQAAAAELAAEALLAVADGGCAPGGAAALQARTSADTHPQRRAAAPGLRSECCSSACSATQGILGWRVGWGHAPCEGGCLGLC